jgi:hypothetical protein
VDYRLRRILFSIEMVFRRAGRKSKILKVRSEVIGD